ncbi:MAG: AI-2E family transporter [Acidimicrobiales bacterium]
MTDLPRHQANDPDAGVPKWLIRVGRISWLAIGVGLAAAAAVAVVMALRELVVPVVLAAFLGAGFIPLVDRLETRRVPRPIGALLVIVLIAAVFAGVIAVVTIGLTSQADELGDQFDVAVDELKERLDRLDPDGEFLDQFRNNSESAGPKVWTGLTSRAGAILDSAVGIVTGIVLGALVLYYMLKDGHMFSEWAAKSLPAASSDQIEGILHESATTVRTYFRSRTVLSFAVAVFIGIAMWLLGVPLPFAIALVNFIGGYIPYFGAFLGGAFAVLLALAGGGPGQAIWALVIVLAANLALENVLEPKILGDSFKLHPIVVLLVTMFGGIVAGLVGLVLAVPLTTISIYAFGELRDSGFFGDREPEADLDDEQSNDENGKDVDYV